MQKKTVIACSQTDKKCYSHLIDITSGVPIFTVCFMPALTTGIIDVSNWKRDFVSYFRNPVI